MRRRLNFAVVSVLLCFVACGEDVSIALVVPERFAGGSVAVDGRIVAEFERYSASDPTTTNPLERRGAIARFGLSLGDHTVTFSNDAEESVTFKLSYDRQTEDYLVVNDRMIAEARRRIGAPLRLDDLQ